MNDGNSRNDWGKKGAAKQWAQPGSYLVDVEFAAEMKRANKVRSKIEFLQV